MRQKEEISALTSSLTLHIPLTQKDGASIDGHNFTR